MWEIILGGGGGGRDDLVYRLPISLMFAVAVGVSQAEFHTSCCVNMGLCKRCRRWSPPARRNGHVGLSPPAAARGRSGLQSRTTADLDEFWGK